MTYTSDKAPDIVERYIDEVRERAPTIAEVMQDAVNYKTRSELHDEIDKLERELARLKSDRLYIIGCNDGYDAAMDQAAQFCESSEARWREDADKAFERDHEDAERQSLEAMAKAYAGGFLASVIRGAVATPLIRGVGLCMLDGKDAEAAAIGARDE